MRRTPVNDYLEDISTELPEEIYGYLSDAIYETVCEFDEEVAQLQTENAKLRELVADVWGYISHPANATWTHEKRKEVRHSLSDRMRELGVEVDE